MHAQVDPLPSLVTASPIDGCPPTLNKKYAQELDVPAAPGPAPVLKRIKRKKGSPEQVALYQPDIPAARTFANYTEADNSAVPAAARSGAAMAALLGAGVLVALLA